MWHETYQSDINFSTYTFHCPTNGHFHTNACHELYNLYVFRWSGCILCRAYYQLAVVGSRHRAPLQIRQYRAVHLAAQAGPFYAWKTKNLSSSERAIFHRADVKSVALEHLAKNLFLLFCTNSFLSRSWVSEPSAQSLFSLCEEGKERRQVRGVEEVGTQKQTEPLPPSTSSSRTKIGSARKEKHKKERTKERTKERNDNTEGGVRIGLTAFLLKLN